MPFVPVPNITHVDSVGTVDDPVTVGGGHVDSVDTVQAVVTAVTAAGGTIDTVAEVQTVVNAVMAAGGTIDTVAEVQSVVNAVTAAGGHVDSVQTVVDAVTAAGGHIDTVASAGIDPAAEIAAVTGSVPFPFRDGAFWPCVSGEPYPPLFNGSAYDPQPNIGSLPAVRATTAGSTGDTRWPALPRLSFAGKTTMTMSFRSFATGTGTTIGVIGMVTSAGTGRAGQRSALFTFTASGSQLVVEAYSDDGAGANTSTTIGTINLNEVHDYAITLSDADVEFSLDGALVATHPTPWPSTASERPVNPYAGTRAKTTGPQLYLALLQVGWS